MSYLMYMSIRLIELKRVLKPTGSLYLHCDPTASHYLKLLMDVIFGKEHFRNEIVWYYSKWSNVSNQFQANHDIVLFYAPKRLATFQTQYKLSLDKQKKLAKGYQINVISGVRQLIYYDPAILPTVDKERYDVIVDRTAADEGSPMPDVWIDINILNSQAKERTGYPTQKPLALLERIITASSNPGDTVLDPFCGCATTCIAAEKLGRHWIGIDISPKAAELVQMRMQKDVGLFFQGCHRLDLPQRTDLGKIIPYNSLSNKKYLYGEQGGYCNGCEHHFPMQNFTVDHIVPQSKGGTDHISNLQLLCGNCNSIKGPRTQEELLLALTDKGYVKRKHAA